jgi:hypothetical protein
MPPTLVQKLNTWPVRCYYSLRPPHLLFLSPRFCFWCVHSVHKYMYIYIFLHMLMYKKKTMPLHFRAPIPGYSEPGFPCLDHACNTSAVRGAYRRSS